MAFFILHCYLTIYIIQNFIRLVRVFKTFFIMLLINQQHYHGQQQSTC